MNTLYAVFNTLTGQFVGPTSADAEEAKDLARTLNLAMKPEFQNYTVATITFDPEV